MSENERVRVLFSFPHRLGGERICNIAWQQVNGIAAEGAEVEAAPASQSWRLPDAVKVRPTLARGRLRIPYRVIGSMRAFAMHDYIVSRRLEKLAGQIDIVHMWPLGALRTLEVAKRLGIPTVLERPNAHTKYAYEIVQRECDRIGVPLPPDHEHAFNAEVLAKEEKEYALADKLLCPSDFVARTFLDYGFAKEKIARHQYGFDEKIYHPGSGAERKKDGFSMIFVGGLAPRKGLHFALEAWLNSPARKDGTFSIAGTFVPGYAEKLASMLSDPSIRVLGYRRDVADLMRASDIFTLPSIEEGSALVTSEARGSGCVLVVSEASGAICTHMENALVHPVGDVGALTEHITLLYNDRALLERLRAASLSTADQLTWVSAGKRLFKVYQETIATHS